MARNTASFAALQGGANPAAQFIGIRVTDRRAATLVAGYPPSTPVPSWLELGLTSSYLSLQVNDTSLPEGTYTTTVRVATLDGNSNMLAQEDVSVTYLVDAQFVSLDTHLDFAYVQGDTPPSATLQILGAGESWTATADAAWVTLGATTGVAPGDLDVGIDPAGLVPGTYNAIITIDDDNSDAAITVTVTLVVTSPLVLGHQPFAFSGLNGGSFPAKQLTLSTLDGAALAWNAAASEPWIVLSANSGTTPQTLNISVDPSQGPLASGSYAGTVTISATHNGTPISATVDVTLSLTKATLIVQTGYLPLGGLTGVSSTSVSINGYLNTGVDTFDWTVTTGDAWLIASEASGSLAGSPDLTLTADRTGMSEGTYSTSFTLTASVNGDTLTKTVPVTLNVAAHELIPETAGVAFTKLPSVSRLSTSVTIRDSYGLSDTPWAAESDSGWLSVTASGVTGGSLVLSADPTALASDQLHYATVTITSSDGSVENSPEIKVALWKGTVDPVASVVVPGSYASLAVDPIRPYVYVHGGGTDIDVVNLYTGGTVGTVATGGGALGDMAVNDDGSELYVMDRDNEEIVVVDVAGMNTSRRFHAAYFPTATNQVVFARTDGHPTLYLSNGFIYDTGGTNVGDMSNYAGVTRIAASADGSRLCRLSESTPYLMSCFEARYSSLLDDIVLSALFYGEGTTGPGVDIAVGGDDKRAYVAVGAGGFFDSYETAATGQLAGAANLNNAHVSVDGTFVGSAAVPGSGTDVWFYGDDQSLIGSRDLSGDGYSVLARQLGTSGDGMRTVAITDQPALVIISTP